MIQPRYVCSDHRMPFPKTVVLLANDRLLIFATITCPGPTQLLKCLDSGLEVRLVEIVGQSEICPLEVPIDVNRKDADGDRTPLHWAAARGSVECLRLLLEYGGDRGALDSHGMTPAALALQCCQWGCYTLLSDYNSVRSHQETPTGQGVPDVS